jgi:DNA replication protein DnaC
MKKLLEEKLGSLKLHYLAANLEDFILECSAKKVNARDFVEYLCELELLEKNRRTIDRRVAIAKIGNFRPINNFDWEHPEKIDRLGIEALFSLEFVEKNRNVVLAGPQGLGKTLIARNLAHHAANRGFTVFTTTASQLVIDLSSAESTAALKRKLRKYTKPRVLVIDEIGYLNFDHKSADLIFEIVSQRYEKGTIILTTNSAFKDWGSFFPGAPCVTAMIDRLTHHCDIFKIEGSSYRKKESKEKNDARPNYAANAKSSAATAQNTRARRTRKIT